jgi:hypothetical protein
MKLLCKALLQLKDVKSLSIKKVIILVLVAFGSGQLSPELITLLLSA